MLSEYRFIKVKIVTCNRTDSEAFKNSLYHKYDLYWRTRGCLAAERNFRDTLFYMQARGIWFREIACRDPHNHPKIDSWLLAESRHIQINAVNLCTGHVYHLKITFHITPRFLIHEILYY